MRAFLTFYLPLIAVLMLTGGMLASCFGAPDIIAMPIALTGFAIYSPYYWMSMQ